MNTPPEPNNSIPSSLEDWMDTKDAEDFLNYTGPTPAGFCFNRDLTNEKDRWDFSEVELRSTFDA